MTTALYRRYRPEIFGEVIGQEHVTAPLMQALRTGRINHAYLFSGPRGCGKTTSARILARCLNCAKGPTDVPCGECDSCRELARGGPGSLDVVEIDAASHGGVDDARDLRERATFAPARDRFKIFILDEAHMVTPQGFNALLKIVEEPPEHVMFIFATTEPDKVIGTIRSRTHHYPFRLVPPDVLTGYLEQLVAVEGAKVGPGVLSLVVRAGAGSVRDSLSVLDQLVAGADEEGIDYERAVALLGYTPATLLDDVVEAVAAGDGASAFRVVDRIISTGHEPRRFVEDLLERLRDLIVIAASGAAADSALRDVPADQLVRMRAQATHLGASELSRAADLVNAALGEMTGATSPRLHLELLIARLLLPAADDGALGYAARLDRLERARGPVGAGSRVAVEAVGTSGAASVAAPSIPPAAAPPAAAAAAPAASPATRTSDPARGMPRAGSDTTETTAARAETSAPSPNAPIPIAVSDAAGSLSRAESDKSGGPGPNAHVSDVARSVGRAEADKSEGRGLTAAVSDAARAVPRAGPDRSSGPSQPGGPTTSSAAPVPAPAPAPAPAAGAETEVLRRRWPEVLETLSHLKKATWALVSQNALIVDLTTSTLTLSFSAPGLANAFRTGPHAEIVQRAVRETLGFDVRVEGVLAEAGANGAAGGGASPSSGRGASGGSSGGPPSGARTSGPASGVDRARAEASWADVEPPDDIEPVEHPNDRSAGSRGQAQSAPASARAAGEHAHADALRAAAAAPPAAEDSPQPDDPDISTSQLSGAPLVAQMLGGMVIDEQFDDGQ